MPLGYWTNLVIWWWNVSSESHTDCKVVQRFKWWSISGFSRPLMLCTRWVQQVQERSWRAGEVLDSKAAWEVFLMGILVNDRLNDGVMTEYLLVDGASVLPFSESHCAKTCFFMQLPCISQSNLFIFAARWHLPPMMIAGCLSVPLKAWIFVCEDQLSGSQTRWQALTS